MHEPLPTCTLSSHIPLHSTLKLTHVCTRALQAIDEGAKAENQWKADLEAYAAKYPAEAAEFKVGGVLVCSCGACAACCVHVCFRPS